MNLKFGADPEVWISHNGKIIPAIGIIPGTKEEPFGVDCGAVQRDGLAAEFNIHPAETRDEWLHNIKTVYGQLDKFVKEANPEFELLATPVAHFDLKEFREYPMESKILGCDPDFNSTGRVNRNPSRKIFTKPLRTASGHVHVGWTEEQDARHPKHFEICRRLAQVISDRHAVPVTEDELERLKYYGMGGSFRPKSYGVEVRSFSNLWLNSDESILKVFDDVKRTTEEFFEVLNA